ncbi:tetratricopeptide repeat protein 21B-like [Galendromus occidentalis]|uniref:Tetratricopeptide repeat protein 21B-like n=1 Tax=Galendromus occidentalis TaxID=34638 RepID=A0AAJ7SER5_9ACAR|nr:tetratricopeptide repeat protein 21B-like [Galendromus occidentalis]
MGDPEVLQKAKIDYYIREKLWNTAQNFSAQAMRRFSGKPLFRFYYSICLQLQNNPQEALRQLEELKNEADFALGVSYALLRTHQSFNNVDFEATANLELTIRNLREDRNDKLFYYAGLYHYLVGDLETAKELVDRMLKLAPPSKEGLVLKGWLELLRQAKTNVSQYFESSGSGNPEAIFGKAEALKRAGDLHKALDVVNQGVVSFPGNLPSILEKMKVHMAMGDWEQVVDTSNRALSMDTNCVQAQRFQVVHLLCKMNNVKEAQRKIREVLASLDIVEPRNSWLYYETASIFIVVSGRQQQILEQCLVLMEKATSFSPKNSTFETGVAKVLVMLKRFKDADKHLATALRSDGQNMEATLTSILVQIQSQGDEGLHAAEQQIDLIQEVHRTQMTPEMLYISALLLSKQHKSPERAIQLLEQAVTKHYQTTEGQPKSMEYLLSLNPDFVVQMIRLYLEYASDRPIKGPGQAVPEILKKCQAALKPVLHMCPAITDANYLMARIKYLSGDPASAQALLDKVTLANQQTSTETYLLLAQVQLEQDSVQSAQQTLEMALSNSFQVRDKPLFHLIKAKVHRKLDENQEALSCLKTAMDLAGLSGGSAKATLNTNDRMNLFLELSDSYRLLGDQKKAEDIMGEALAHFKGTPEEIKVSIAGTELALSRGNVDQALALLQAIGPEESYYLDARERMANIYLQYRKDTKLYVTCYRDIAKMNQTADCFLMLGDALMKIHDHEGAIEAYENALKKNPRDYNVGRKMGQLLVRTHFYDKAITFYKAAIKTGGESLLRYDLAHLLLRLQRFKESEDVINATFEPLKQQSDLQSLQWESKFTVLLAKNYHANPAKGNDASIRAYQKAYDIQSRVMMRVHLEAPDSVQEQLTQALHICSRLAAHAESKKDYQQALKFLRQALHYDQTNLHSLSAVAKAEMASNNLEQARQYCNQILKIDKDNDNATLMMADIMFRKTDLENSLIHFEKLLLRKPEYYPALARLIEACRRLGCLDKCKPFLDSPPTVPAAGFYYCRGLYDWYTENTQAAMKNFNQARGDLEWGVIATYHMIEICCNPDNNTLGSETFDSSSSPEEIQSIIETAETLLAELRTKVPPSDLDLQIMSNFVLLAKKNKQDAEIALNDFLQISSDEKYREHVGAILGISTAHMILKQVPKARNHLKRVIKSVWNFGDAEYLEKAWLLLADVYIHSGKYDYASDLIKRVLQYNRSCTRAYEYMGYIMEKEQSYRDAANCYESAWKLTHKPTIGYKLAFNYLKGKRFVDAISVCHQVLALYPEYPKIKKEVMDRARSNLRM